MPLEPNMQLLRSLEPDVQKKSLRDIKAELPDDITQKEFWNFVRLIGAQLFGEKAGVAEKAGRTDTVYLWNIKGSFEEFVQTILHTSLSGENDEN